MRLSFKLPIIFFVAIIYSGTRSVSSEARQPVKPSYYPHWVSRDGNVSDKILRRLAPGTIIGVHHEWSLTELRRILDASGKFKLSWYVEANVRERNDPAPIGMPVAQRIAAARRKQTTLAKEYPPERFANLIELDGARDKYEGQLRGRGNGRNDWVADAKAAKSAGFRYVAKSPTHAHVKALRKTLGADFVPHIVFEDVTGNINDANPGYRKDAKQLAAAGESMTLIVHEGAYGDFPATPLAKAHTIVKADFDFPNIEMYWGRTTADLDFVKLKDFEAPAEPNAPLVPQPDLPVAVVPVQPNLERMFAE
jgi:hypothetical protein